MFDLRDAYMLRLVKFIPYWYVYTLVRREDEFEVFVSVACYMCVRAMYVIVAGLYRLNSCNGRTCTGT